MNSRARAGQIYKDTVATGSCGSCHIGEAGGKAGQQLNFNTGGEGRGYTDAMGNFFPRRRAMSTLLKVRDTPLFPGDALVDALPTLMDICQFAGRSSVVTTPALFYHNIGDTTLRILQSGRLDQIDSVGRQSPANGLYDPTFADTFNLNATDLDYSANHPTLKAKGAIDGVLLSGLAMDDNDPLARRDQGLEFLDVTSQVSMAVSTSGSVDTWVITNTSAAVIDTHLLAVVKGLPAGITVDAKEKTTAQVPAGGKPSAEPAGLPYYRIFLPSGVLNPGQSISLAVTRSGGGSSGAYGWKFYSGQGKP